MLVEPVPSPVITIISCGIQEQRSTQSHHKYPLHTFDNLIKRKINKNTQKNLFNIQYAPRRHKENNVINHSEGTILK